MASRKVVLKVAGISLAVLGGVLLVAVFALVALSRPVEGHSMEPTLHNGDRLFVTPGTGGQVHRFDVVLLNERDNTIVKRVIGLPGDRVAIEATSTDPYVVLLQEGGAGPWYQVREPAWAGRVQTLSYCCGPDGTISPKPEAQTVPAGKFFYLGDNPDVSEDARKFGWGTVSDVAGRVGLRTWPLGAAKGIGDAPTLVAAAGPVG
jgi:signal peptidase I